MTRTVSPLRYPGGKSALNDMVSSVLHANRLESGYFVEPFVGGGGLALSLLFEGMVRHVHLNDVDPAIAAFWRIVLDYNDALCELINATPVTIREWHRQKSIYANSTDDLELGFATLFLNRTNRSGIIKGAGVIGGLNQTGNYLLDCRFNKADLIRKIKRIAKYRHRINFMQLDAVEFITGIERELPCRSLIFGDPPYFGKGARLYTSFYKPGDHAVLADVMMKIRAPWIMTYDNCPEIAGIYRFRRQFEFHMHYSVQTRRFGSELLVVSNGLELPGSLGLERRQLC